MKLYLLKNPLRVIRTLPVNLNQEDIALFQNSIDEIIPASFLTNISNANIFNNLVFSGIQIRDKDCRTHPLSYRQKLKALLKLSLAKISEQNLTLDRGV